MPEQEPTAEATSAADESAKNTPAWRRMLTKKRLAMILGGAILLPVLGYVAVAASSSSEMVTVSPEVSLGAFWYETTTEASDEKIRAEFNLHLDLLAQIDTAARERLEARRFKVQQNVEELLRQAHNADFEDPSLTELKRQIQVQINETLAMRGAIAEVIVTDLVVEVLEEKSKQVDAKKKTSIYRDLNTDATPTKSEKPAVDEQATSDA
jgi:flagellar basal body-associated protein FliL